MVFANTLFNDNVRLLKSQVSKTAYQGVFIAVASIIIATMLVSYYHIGTVSADGIIMAQQQNYVLWVLDTVPFVFGFWGQYSSSVIAYQAGALIYDQTEALRNRAEHLEKQANYTATHDILTDLPNRALFYDRVEQSIYSASSLSRMLSVLLVEIANYKEIYDTLGHNSCDLVVKQLATRLQGVVLGSDKVARIDGNVFSVLLSEGCDESDALSLAKYIQTALEPVFMVDQLHIPVHANIGIVNFPEHGEDVDTLVQKAGVALFMAAKSNEGYAIYEPAFDDHSPRRLTLMSELRRAIESSQLELYYQAKVSLQSGQLFGAEALLRWQHPRHGFIPPDEFIIMAERTRMIKPLTLWVLKEAFKQSALWHAQGKDLIISVNLSTRDLHDPELPDLVSGIAASTGIRPEWVMLEITESSIMTDPDRALEIIKRLNGMGYQFSIDDYGTGYSSLAYLKKMPLAELKIDRSFVAEILTNENDEVIVNATINLAHNLGLHVTAEGVENEAIMHKLSAHGCDLVQGYFFNQPMSLADFECWMQENPWQAAVYQRSS
ncbi:bifunctional diguanylate cyclase/phosphodiesterase [Methylomarinum sp. Ch1-1]|uniref:Bifunctional diguanylate cyclase/phosphodiesterase n=1 Tax=Methylomarinum roseum TaxID=3067653 RepID=A0AAU7NQ01_9GAMM|nr:bifunctional diguanylate cyclase/phosphodiesterase [Methylomarinum sp. Ch1-1]MDP4521040.1 bifunctional diguanylate cyclase/phosphodiesterase [Methylomarinum sp. Ch1-1]